MSAEQATPAVSVRRRRLQLLALAGLFFGPLGVSAWLYFHGGSWRPAGHVNHGQLIDSPRPLPPLGLATPAGGRTEEAFLRRKWSLVTITADACDRRCWQALVNTRTVQLALDANGTRVQRVLLANVGCCGEAAQTPAQRDLVTAWLDAGDARRLYAALRAARAPVPAAGRIYVVDPHANLVISYAPDADPRGLLLDLERLLRLSQIG